MFSVMLMLNSLGEDMLFAFLTALVVIILKKQRISCCHSRLAVINIYVKLPVSGNVTFACTLMRAHHR